jgi:hypothetical protein
MEVSLRYRYREDASVLDAATATISIILLGYSLFLSDQRYCFKCFHMIWSASACSVIISNLRFLSFLCWENASELRSSEDYLCAPMNKEIRLILRCTLCHV